MTDFADREGVIWLDGAMVPWRDAKTHFLTHSLHYASAVFEGVRAYNGRIFKLRQHTDRLFEGAGIVGMKMPFTRDVIDAACQAVLAANHLEDGYLRPAVWRGSEVMGLSPRGTAVHVAIAAWSWPSYFSVEQRMTGVRLIEAPWRRPAPDTAPTQAKASGLYQICTLSKQYAEDRGYDDALMLDYRGLVAEATGANIFLVIDGKLHTPTPDCFLNGITRQTAIEIAEQTGIDIVERHITPEDLALADEVFLTGTAAEITPVSEIGPHRFTPGPVCHLMIKEYTRITTGGAA